MNGNIEVINENLWAVNFEYIYAGFIQELIPRDKTLGSIALTNNGVIVINSASLIYPAIKKILPQLMMKSSQELRSIIDKGNTPDELDALDDLILNLSGWEIKRRSIMDDYLKCQQYKKIFDVIKETVRRKVTEHGKHTNRNTTE